MRLWITGIGLVTPLGIGAEATWARLVRGERAVAPIKHSATEGYRASLGCEVRGIEDHAVPQTRAWSRTARMAYVAAREALESSGVEARGGRRVSGSAGAGSTLGRVGLVVGGTTGGMLENEELLARVYADPSKQEELAELLSHPLWATTDRLAEALGPFARVRTLSSACSSGANAIVTAAVWLLSGALDAVVAGGTDGLCRLTLAGFNALAAVDPEPCRPFDARRRGLNLGEGAGFVVLERADRARARGRTPVAELAGWSLGAEAHHITNPESTGETPRRVIERALARAGLEQGAVDYVNAHGTGTPRNDPMECAAIVAALREGVVVSSSKGQIGHTLAAAGAIEAAITALVVAKQTVVPTAGLAEVDPECARVAHVPGEGRAMRVRAAVSNSFGFGGMDTALAITEPELGREHAASARSVVITGVSTLAAADLPGVDAALDAERARRLDRPSRLAAFVVDRARADAGQRDSECGVVLGSTFGSIDASAAFMHRIFARGPRLASPAEFPNLVPSAPVGHVSIYLGLRGPVLAVSELGAAGECAAMQAAELIAAGEVDGIVAADVEEPHGIIERVMAALYAEPQVQSDGEGGGAVLLEAEEHATARGARVMARVVALTSWRDGEPAPALPTPRDSSRAHVVIPRESHALDAALASSAWGTVGRVACEDAESSAIGATALAVAARRLSTGASREALVIGLARGRGYAVLLAAP